MEDCSPALPIWRI